MSAAGTASTISANHLLYYSTEFLWAYIKPPLKRHLVLRSLDVDVDRPEMCRILLGVLHSVDLQTIVNLTRASIRSIRATFDAI